MANDLPCATRTLQEMRAAGVDLALLRRTEAHLAFHEGRYASALELLEGVASSPGGDAPLEAELAHYRATVEATSDFVEEKRGRTVVRFAPGVDQILVEEVFETMEAAYREIDPLIGVSLPQSTLVEIYPTGRRFIAASGLGAEAVRTTGVVALSKWARLLVTSPRALARGYAWKDTVVHEYIHALVAFRTQDRAPVWLQEGIARHLEGRWRSPTSQPLGPYAQSLLAAAIARKDLVSFEEMHPSMAFLPSAERASLAFAQVKVLVEFAMARGGDAAIASALGAVAQGEDARIALGKAAGHPDFESFLTDAMRYLEGLDLVKRRLARLPLVIDAEADEFDSDPLLAERRDMADFARLGDLLLEARRPRAALVEYGKAMPEDGIGSPLLATRVATCHARLNDKARAIEELRASTRDYPDYALTWRTLGELVFSLGRAEEALAAYRAAADINPYDPAVQGALSRLHASRGETDAALRHERYQRILTSRGLSP
jgi:tetratricopeptide (TPR) repeat protein